MTDRCDCGFGDDSVSMEAVPARARAGADAIAARLHDGAGAPRRPVPDRWSALEYAAHVRDVLLTVRDRLVIGLVEDRPHFEPMYRDERLSLGLYRADGPGPVALEVVAAAAMFGRLFAAIDPAALGREVHYGFPESTIRTLAWMGRQAVHETEHHLADIVENARRLSS